MRKLAILIAFLMAVLFTGTAFASDEQEQLIHEQFGTGSYATWLRDDGTWDNGKPGTDQSTKPHEYSIPAEKLKNYKLTRIEVKTGYSFDPEAFEKAGGWQRISEYDDYADEILRYTPDNLAVTDTHDLATGKVNVTWSLRLSPTQPPENRREARETVDLNVREHLRQLGFKLEDDKVYEDFREGWLWCLPVYIEWYGVPKQAVQPPDFSVTLDRYEFKDVKPGDKITITATYKLNDNHPQPEKARLGAFHVLGAEYPVALEPVEPDDKLNSEGIIEFNPGETKQFVINVTVQNKNSVVQAKIWPAGTSNDANWTNNKAEAHIMLNQNLWVEPIGNNQLEAREGNSVNVTTRIHNDIGSMITTRLVWKLDGKVVKDVSNFDLISQETDSITVKPGIGSHTITVEVNPDRNRPAEEATFDDNKTTYTINITPQQEEVSGNVQIIGPDSWDALKPYPFTVKISGYLPYERYRNRDGHIRYRSKTYNMNVNTHGEGVLTIQWSTDNQFGNPQKTKPVVKSWSENYSRSSGSFTKTIDYEFPPVGMRGFAESNLVIEATDSRFGTARKIVKINPAPVTKPDLKLTK